MTRKIKIYLITGFLGSGKTTLLNRIISHFSTHTFGLIINDFGQIAVDSELIKSQHKELFKSDTTQIVEIPNGSIFCSCLESVFVDGLNYYQKVHPDYLFVETSGLSDPSSMTKILDETRLIESYALDQVICMVDATKFLKLFDSLPVLSRQIRYSDIIILNKIDLVNPKILEQIKSEINSMNVKAKIFETSFAEMNMDSLNKVDTIEKKESQESINQPLKRPTTLYLKQIPTTVLNLRTFLNEIEGKVLRIKGFIKIDEEMYYVDDNNDRITLEKVPAATQKPGISVICKQGYDEKIKKSWEKYIQVDYLCI